MGVLLISLTLIGFITIVCLAVYHMVWDSEFVSNAVEKEIENSVYRWRDSVNGMHMPKNKRKNSNIAVEMVNPMHKTNDVNSSHPVSQITL